MQTLTSVEEPTGLIVATCSTCGMDLQSDMLCELRHEPDGQHTVIHGEKTKTDDGRLIGDALVLNYDAERAERIAHHVERRKQVQRADFVEGVEHLVFGDRQHGKTWLAMRWLTEAPEGEERVLIVGTVIQAENLREQYGMARNDQRVISWRQLASHRRGRSTANIRYGIDDAHSVLADMLALQQLRLLTVLTAGPGQGDTSVDLGDPGIVLECDRCDAKLGSVLAGKLIHGRNGAHTPEFDAF